ncbi:hypothetical protein CPHO_03350 [Corynebacterium phocae]|uniref:ComEC/Rec2-related protein domain-containing protein n=2 Tax=Corynebacterium phocae TaxID=161895 RepID=A0A1L7D666_9CORY|nr:hypothetical protein CPHO_03350 [Corynebacterium phocae]KAA8726543.1 ComEC/Rec2 family competence protein [Corynebacterium phocae]
MSELRLLPAALAAWLVLLLPVPGNLVALAVGAAVAWGLGQRGQAVLIPGVGLATIIRAAVVPAPSTTVTATPRRLSSGQWAVPLGPDTKFFDHLPAGAVKGSHYINGSFAPPTGWSGFAHEVSTSFAQAVTATVGPSSQGLIPGMVLGDTSLQTQAEREMFISTGLSHLSAVSGANISLVTTAAFICMRLLGASPRLQVAGAVAAMAVFVGLVGPEPSVMRASVTGLVGLAAVVASARMQPIHALSLGVIALLMLRPGLAGDFGFALSVAATAGIVVAFPYLYRALAPVRLPDILTRALAVAIAADAATIPIVAAMTGQVSVVAVLANILVAPATAPVTILGLMAVIAAPLGLATPLLHAVEPFTWWIYHVAQWAAGLNVTTVVASPVAVVLAYGWVFRLLRHPRWVLAAAVVGLVVLCVPRGQPARLDTVVAIVSEEQARDVPGVDAYVISSPGPPNARPVRTPGGIPVLYPQRDGPVRVMADGTQRGRFGAR